MRFRSHPSADVKFIGNRHGLDRSLGLLALDIEADLSIQRATASRLRALCLVAEGQTCQ